jgi:hypothetical protein
MSGLSNKVMRNRALNIVKHIYPYEVANPLPAIQEENSRHVVLFANPVKHGEF